MKQKLYSFLSQPYIVVVVMVIAPLLSYFDRNYGYFFGLFVALFLLWGSGWNWAKFGLGRRLSLGTVWKGIALAVGIYVVVDIAIQPFLEVYFGPIDLSSLDDIRGNFGNYLVLMAIMWVFAAFGEEFLFSGYYMKHLAELLGNTNRSWLVSAVILSVYFGASHNYQGTAGMIAVGLASTAYYFAFTRNRDNLALLVIAHGCYDSIGLTMIYLERDRTFFDWVSGWLAG